MDIKKIEDFLLSKVTDNEKTITILHKWEKEILFMMNKKIKQKIIIEFLFENDKILKNRYNNEKRLRTFQSLLSKFCNKLNLKKEEINHVKIEKNENKEEISSSQNEEPKKIDDNIVSKKKIDDNIDDNIDDKDVGVRVNLPDIENVNAGLIESKNKNRIK